MAKVAEGTGGDIVAEFHEVARHWKRMCKKYWTVTSCHGCPIAEHEEAYEACSADEIDVVKMEELVMAWAAEHPEPVYPTVYEWLVSIGLLGSDMWAMSDLYKPIPADIAEELGIQPKEDT